MTKNAVQCADAKPIALRAWIGVLLLAFVLRAGWLLAVPVVPVSDSARYDFFAQRLAEGKGYTEADGRPTAYWPVGPSFAYSLVYRLTGPQSPWRLVGAGVLNLLLGVGSVALVMHLGRVWFSPRVGVAAGLLLACWPSQIEFTTVVASETLMIFLMLRGLAFWYATRRPGGLRLVFAGICFALAGFMRPTALLVPVMAALCDVLRGPQRVRTVGRLAVTCAVMALCIAPWTYRNYRVFHALVPISTNGGVNFWMGNSGAYSFEYISPPTVDEFDNEAARDRALKTKALENIRENPADFLRRSAIKAIRLHERETIGVVWNEGGLTQRLGNLEETRNKGLLTGLKLLSTAYWWAAAVLGVWGFVALCWRQSLFAAVVCPAVLIWGYFTVVHAVTVIQDRYHFAAVPMIALLAAYGILGKQRETHDATETEHD